jgi:YegS/Rv2252/BmrU family lipid kinase
VTLKRATIIYNPASGGGHREQQLDVARRLLEQHRIESECWPTQGPGHATELAAQALAQQMDLIIVKGGDGTLNEALQAMAGSHVPLAIWPSGTANVLAKVLRLPKRFGDLMNVIVAGRTKPITVGRANGRYFFLMAGIGLDASIVRHVNPKLKHLGGELAFWASGFKHLATWRAPQFTVRINGHEFQATFAAIANAPDYGGGLRLAPQARIESECLDVCAFSTQSKLRYLLWYLPVSFLGRHVGRAGVSYLHARNEIRAESDEEIWVQVDGEVLGTLPMTFAPVPQAISVVIA